MQIPIKQPQSHTLPPNIVYWIRQQNQNKHQYQFQSHEKTCTLRLTVELKVNKINLTDKWRSAVVYVAVSLSDSWTPRPDMKAPVLLCLVAVCVQVSLSVCLSVCLPVNLSACLTVPTWHVFVLLSVTYGQCLHDRCLCQLPVDSAYMTGVFVCISH